MMSDKIKALEERIKKLESVIVYLMCPKDSGIFEKSVGKSADQILREALTSQVARGVNYLIQEYGSAEQVIQRAHAICDGYCEHKK